MAVNRNIVKQISSFTEPMDVLVFEADDALLLCYNRAGHRRHMSRRI